MNEELIRMTAKQVAAELAERGKIIEGGWRAYVIVNRMNNLPENMTAKMRKIWMLSAQHLFATIMATLDPGAEVTAGDLKRIELIHQELEAFRRSLGN